MIRLKQYLERLRCDVHMLSLNKRQGKLLGSSQTESAELPDEGLLERSNDSDRMVSEQISNTLEIISKIIEANISIEGDDSFSLDKERLERGKSIKMDTTIMSEME